MRREFEKVLAIKICGPDQQNIIILPKSVEDVFATVDHKNVVITRYNVKQLSPASLRYFVHREGREGVYGGRGEMVQIKIV